MLIITREELSELIKKEIEYTEHLKNIPDIARILTRKAVQMSALFIYATEYDKELNDARIGLFQIPLSIIKSLGFIGNLEDMFNITTQLSFAIRYLDYIYEKFEDMKDTYDRLAITLASYNENSIVIKELEELKAETKQSKFIKALNKSLKWEGGLNDIPEDAGGISKFGISLRFLKMNNLDINMDGVVDKNDIVSLQKEQVIDIYKKYFWDKLKCDEIDRYIIKSQIFDMGINMGGKTAIKIAQKCCNTLGESLVVDGIIGKNTVNAINSVSSSILNNLMVEERIKYYNKIVENKPTQAKFIKGWANRAKSFFV